MNEQDRWRTAIEARLDSIERRLTVFDVAISLARWAGPIIVAIAAIAIGKL